MLEVCESVRICGSWTFFIDLKYPEITYCVWLNLEVSYSATGGTMLCHVSISHPTLWREDTPRCCQIVFMFKETSVRGASQLVSAMGNIWTIYNNIYYEAQCIYIYIHNTYVNMVIQSYMGIPLSLYRTGSHGLCSENWRISPTEEYRCAMLAPQRFVFYT